MAHEDPSFTLRTTPEILEKLKIIAEYEVRTLSQEIEYIARRGIETFEKQHGPIILDDDNK